MTKEWITKNIGGIVLSTVGAVFIYGLGAFISSRISTEMKSYVPITIWSQWAQERSEWRGGVDQQLKTLKEEQNVIKRDLIEKLSGIDKKVDIQTIKAENQTLAINELKDALKQHMADKPK